MCLQIVCIFFQPSLPLTSRWLTSGLSFARWFPLLRSYFSQRLHRNQAGGCFCYSWYRRGRRRHAGQNRMKQKKPMLVSSIENTRFVILIDAVTIPGPPSTKRFNTIIAMYWTYSRSYFQLKSYLSQPGVLYTMWVLTWQQQCCWW